MRVYSLAPFFRGRSCEEPFEEEEKDEKNKEKEAQ